MIEVDEFLIDFAEFGPESRAPRLRELSIFPGFKGDG
jgi:hypothetical protein